MTDNEKLARWQGLEPKEYDVEDFAGNVTQEYEPVPDYLNDDAAAMSLLDTLVEKGYIPSLNYNMQYLGWSLDLKRTDRYVFIDNKFFSARRESVVAAVLELIEKEDV